MESHPLVESLLRNAAPRTASRLAGRERVTEAAFACGLLAAAVAMLVLLDPSARPLGWSAVALVVLCAVAGRVHFSVAGGEAPLALRFRSLTGTWQVDDVFVDPFKRG